jgi:hypothetical protein
VGAAVSLLLLVAGLVLVWSAAPEIAGVDPRVAGPVLVVLGATGLVLAFLAWSTGPRPRKDESRRGERTLRDR